MRIRRRYGDAGPWYGQGLNGATAGAKAVSIKKAFGVPSQRIYYCTASRIACLTEAGRRKEGVSYVG